MPDATDAPPHLPSTYTCTEIGLAVSGSSAQPFTRTVPPRPLAPSKLPTGLPLGRVTDRHPSDGFFTPSIPYAQTVWAPPPDTSSVAA